MLCFESLESCESVDGLVREAGRFARLMGFEWWTHRVGRRSEAEAFGAIGESWSIGQCPEGLATGYLDSRMASTPAASKSIQHGVPYGWNASPPEAAAECDAFDELVAAHGVAAGISAAVCRPDGHKGQLLLMSSTPMSEGVLRSLGPMVLMFAHQLQAACIPHVERQAIVFGRLSRRENECMQWAARGKTAWEISRVLAVSEHTVIFHLRNATSKLGAVNRQQAVARWVQMPPALR